MAAADSEGQGIRACCSLWGHKESDTTEWLSNKKMATLFFKLQGKLVKMKLLKVTKTDSFLYMQLGKASLIKQFSWLLRKQKYA